MIQTYYRGHFSDFSEEQKQKSAGRDNGIQVLIACPCNKEFMTKAVEEQRRCVDSLTALYRELPGVESSSLKRCTLGTICNNEEDFSHFQFHALPFSYYNLSQQMYTIRVTVML